VLVRFGVAGTFFALFLAHKLGAIALLVGGYDLFYGSLYLVGVYRPKYLENEHV